MTILNFKTHKPSISLTNEALIRRCPSIGATAPIKGASDKYSFIPTINAVNFLRDAGWHPVEAKEGKTRNIDRSGFQQHIITFTRPEFDLGDRRADLNLYNSHDTGSSYIIAGKLERLVCSNGMVIGSTYAEFRHRHMGFNPDLFIESAKFVADSMTQVAERVQEWETIELTPNEQGVFAQAAHNVLYEGTTHPSTRPDQLLEIRRQADKGDDLWHTFNRIQENVIKGGLSGRSVRGRRTRTRGITNIKRDKILNQSMWDMAEYLAEYKTAA